MQSRVQYEMWEDRHLRCPTGLGVCRPSIPSRLGETLIGFVLLVVGGPALLAGDEPASFDILAIQYERDLRPMFERFCLECHCTQFKEGDLDLERFRDFGEVRLDLQAWQKVGAMIAKREMPPEDSEQPSAEERRQLRDWVQRYLAAEARTRAGDPGPVVLRRLTNAEYNYTVHDLTGVELDPTREFPEDGAAGEGFLNTGNALGMSPALLKKYFEAGKHIASHAVLLPDGFRFSTRKTRRDWVDEVVAEIRAVYARHTSGTSDVSALDGWPLEGDWTKPSATDGRVDLNRYFTALLRHRELLLAGVDGGAPSLVEQPPAEAPGSRPVAFSKNFNDTLAVLAKEEHLSRPYLQHLATMLVSNDPHSLLLDSIRQRWRMASAEEGRRLVQDIRGWQGKLWKTNAVGHIGLVQQWKEPVAPTEGFEDFRAKAEKLMDGAPAEVLLKRSFDEFRRLFPQSMCFARIIPVDETVNVVLFHREDEPLRRLMLDDAETAKLDRLWEELSYVSREPLVLESTLEHLLPESRKATRSGDAERFASVVELITQNAEQFRRRLVETEAVHLDALLDFASRAYRRPLTEAESQGLRLLYRGLRDQPLSHETAFRFTLARVLASAQFLYRIEARRVLGEGVGDRRAPGHFRAHAVSDHELASRLSYFLWSSMPDAELRTAAEAGRLGESEVLRAQTRRMRNDARVRRLATEFACQWLHIRDFDQFVAKSERQFPGFAGLRDAMYEESIRFFTDLFQNDGSILSILNADHTFLNEPLAAYYGIPGVEGEHWRRVEGVGKYGRGGILTQATILAKNSGASRSNPILRGSWVSETLLGEQLPRPPKNVPQLADFVPKSLSERELIERHSSVAACAKCHARIDPYGLALEQFDAIGRRRLRDTNGFPIDTRTTLSDGVTINGHQGLREYLLRTRRLDFVRQFCRKLLGYSLGRAVQLSDEPLLDEILERLAEEDYRVSVAVETIVLSDPFRKIREAPSSP